MVILVPLFDFLKKKNKVKFDIPTYGTEVKDNKTENADDVNVTGDEHNSQSPRTLQDSANENSRQISIPDASTTFTFTGGDEGQGTGRGDITNKIVC